MPSELDLFNYAEDTSSYWMSEQLESEVSEIPVWSIDQNSQLTLEWGDEDLVTPSKEELVALSLDYNSELAPPPAPPFKVEFLCLLLRDDETDAVIGDLIERYSKLHRRLGKQRADLYAYTEVLRSIYPFIKRTLVKTAVMVLLGEWIRKLTS